jgi:cupin 2 domain-containing protein
MTTIPMRGNLFEIPDGAGAGERFDDLMGRDGWRLERIVSTGQATPAGTWLEQERAEWVVLLSGGASLRFEDAAAPVDLAPGDWVWIGPRRRHRVEYTDGERPTVWLALHHDDPPKPDHRAARR